MGEDELEGLRDQATVAWHRYLDVLVPLRPALYAYCRRLTGNVWDAEDLVQDTVLRGFGALGMADRPIDNPRAYLVRVATNLWTDTMRRRSIERNALASEATGYVEAHSPPDAGDVRDAAALLSKGSRRRSAPPC